MLSKTMKFICAGLPKTGTKSLARALRVLGYKVYDADEQILYYMNEWLDLFERGKVPDFYSMFKDVDAVTDVPSSFFFEELVEAFPEAKVILSVRQDEDAWVQSYNNQVQIFKKSNLTKMRWFFPTYNNLWKILRHTLMAAIGIDDPNSLYICRKRYHWHNDRVKSLIPAEKLLVYSVEQGWKPLCHFTGKTIPDQPFPHLNVKGAIFQSFLIETELGKRVTREVKAVILCFVVMVAIIGMLLMYCFA